MASIAKLSIGFPKLHVEQGFEQLKTNYKLKLKFQAFSSLTIIVHEISKK